MLYQKLPEHIRNAVVFSHGPTPDDPQSNYPGFHKETIIIPKGFQKSKGVRRFMARTIFERDEPVQLRDGTIIYVDIFRPDIEDKIPVIINSTMFGKSTSYMNLNLIPNRAGVPLDATSGFETFEGVDPAYWCDKGYAVINMDIRGIGRSEGNACYFGSQDAADNYDVIEYFGQVEWSNGRVAMAGNSWLAITQWYVAALQPPHLCCIAPWEGHGNMYEDEYVRGGIPNFSAAREHMSYSYQKMEDLSENMRKFPLMNEYWEDKCAEFEKITCPAYVVASYTSTLHTHGTIEGYRRISSSEKWLRIHNTWEWPDLYSHEEDLRKFFDYYMKDKNNGWNKVPRVRMAVLDPGHTEHPPIVDRAEKSFPLERQQLVKLYLNAGNGTLVTTNPLNHCHVRYEGCPQNTCCQRNHYSAKFEEEINDPTEVSMVSFSYLFEKDTEITGYSKVKLWVEAETANDMDVYVRITKLDSNGRLMLHNSIMYNYPGPNGMLRASLRETNPEKSTPCEPYHPYKTVSYLSQGEIVPLEIGLWPTSMIFHAGETLRLCISGYDYLGRVGHSLRIVNFNKGGHIIHTGGEYDSYLILPIVH